MILLNKTILLNDCLMKKTNKIDWKLMIILRTNEIKFFWTVEEKPNKMGRSQIVREQWMNKIKKAECSNIIYGHHFEFWIQAFKVVGFLKGFTRIWYVSKIILDREKNAA